MIRNNKKLFNLLSTLCMLLLIIASPNWLKLNQIAPCWPVIWLLPFSLKNGPLKSFLAAILLGIIMDSVKIGASSYIPSLAILSLVWGRFGIHYKNISLLFNIGLMSIFGTVFVGISIWLQKIFLYAALRNNWFHAWSMHVLISEIIITGLVAPIFSSWLLISYKKN